MKGCARSLLFQLVQFLAAVGAVMAFFQFQHRLPPGKSLGASLFAGVFGWIGLTLLFGILRPVSERSALRDCLGGRRPRDGTRVGIAGTIAATGELLRAPISGTECVAYKYEIFQIVGSGKQRMHHRYFEGIALVPSVITTPSGTFRLLAVPTFDFGTDSISPERALAHWSEHVKATRFEPPSSNRTLEKQWTDDDGAYRCEKDHTGGKPAPLTESTFQEDLVKSGDRVYAVGLFSESRGGLVPHANWAKETRIMKGDPESILGQLKKRIVRYCVGGILCLAAAAGIVAAFIANARP